MTDEDTAQTIVPPAPVGETKADAFKRLATARMTAAITKIRLLGNLSNTGSYEYNSVQVEKMKEAIIGEVAASFSKFERRDKDKPLFDFNAE